MQDENRNQRSKGARSALWPVHSCLCRCLDEFDASDGESHARSHRSMASDTGRIGLRRMMQINKVERVVQHMIFVPDRSVALKGR